MKKFGKVVIIGGSGMVGMELIEVMARHQHQPKELIVTANRTAGNLLKTPYGELEIQPTTVEICEKADLVYLAAGAETSLKLSQPILDFDSKVKIIDLSSAFRYEEKWPLVIWSINGDTVKDARLIATPNCTSSIALMVLAPLHKKFTIRKIHLASYQAASGAGKEALDALESQISMWAQLGYPPEKASTASHRYPLAGNLIPHIDITKPEWHGYTKEEMKCVWETNKILFRTKLDDRSIPITATCVRVPVRRCHSIVLTVKLDAMGNLTAKAAQVLVKAFGVVMMDNLAGYVYPMPLNMENKEEVGVGRLRQSQDLAGDELEMWVVGDQLLRGAALSAVEIAENIF